MKIVSSVIFDAKPKFATEIFPSRSPWFLKYKKKHFFPIRKQIKNVDRLIFVFYMTLDRFHVLE